jgi:hypothetical protein
MGSSIAGRGGSGKGAGKGEVRRAATPEPKKSAFYRNFVQKGFTFSKTFFNIMVIIEEFYTDRRVRRFGKVSIKKRKH